MATTAATAPPATRSQQHTHASEAMMVLAGQPSATAMDFLTHHPVAFITELLECARRSAATASSSSNNSNSGSGMTGVISLANALPLLLRAPHATLSQNAAVVGEFARRCENDALDPEASAMLAELRAAVAPQRGGSHGGPSSQPALPKGHASVAGVPVEAAFRFHSSAVTATAQMSTLGLFKPPFAKRFITLPPRPTAADLETIYNHGNAAGGSAAAARADPRFDAAKWPTFRDYLDQQALEVTRTLFDEQVSALMRFRQDYARLDDPANPVTLATKVIVKIMMDAYVKRIPLLDNFSFLREVSYAFLPMLRNLAGAEFLCVRKQTFNLIAALATHVQLVDRQDCFAGSTRAVEQEVAWLLRRVLEYQLLTVDAEDPQWIASLKCCLLVFASPEDWSRVHVGALAAMMSVPIVAAAYPRAFNTLADGLARNLEAASVAGESHLAEALAFLENGEFLVDLLAAAPSVEASVSLVRAIALATKLLVVPLKVPSKAASAWEALERYRVPWCLHLLAAQLPGPTGFSTLAKELATSIIVAPHEQEHEVKHEIHNNLLPRLVSFVLERLMPPPAVARATIGEIVDAAPVMLVDASDITLRRRGAQLLLYALKTHPMDNATARAEVTDKVCEILRSNHLPKFHHASNTIARSVPRLLSATHPHAKSAFLRTAAALLDPARKNVPVPPLMTFYRALMETLAAAGPVDRLSGDMTSMIRTDAVKVSEGVLTGNLDVTFAHEPGQAYNVLWCLYHALRAYSTIHAVRQAREVVLAVIATYEPSRHWHWSGRDLRPKTDMDIWHDITRDPHAPCALLAAERFVQIAALKHYEHYEAALKAQDAGAATGTTSPPGAEASSPAAGSTGGPNHRSLLNLTPQPQLMLSGSASAITPAAATGAAGGAAGGSAPAPRHPFVMADSIWAAMHGGQHAAASVSRPAHALGDADA